MLEYFLPVTIKSKPTGNVGRGGNLYQNTSEYLQFKKDSLQAFKGYEPYPCLQSCEGILIIGFMAPSKKRAKDTGQMNGAIYDILVTAKVIADDRKTNFSKGLFYYFTDKEIQGYFVAIAESKEDWKKLLIDESEAKQCRDCF